MASARNNGTNKRQGRKSLLAAVPPSKPKRKKIERRRESWKELTITELPGASRFSADGDNVDVLAVIRDLKAHPQFLDPIRKLIGPAAGQGFEALRCGLRGPKRAGGDWLLLYLAYVLTKNTSMHWFASQKQTNENIYAECGFSSPPDYQTMRIRFRELEGHWQALKHGADLAIQHAKRHDDEIGKIVIADATGWEAEVGFAHCCPRDSACWKTENKGKVHRANADEVKAAREKEHDTPVLEEGELPSDALVHGQIKDGYLYLQQQNGCWYRTTDLSVGGRIYVSGGKKIKGWLGGFGLVAVDTRTRLILANEEFKASEVEAKHFGDLRSSLLAATGENPLVISCDRGHSYDEVFEMNTRDGIASVIPWRKRGPLKEREAMRTDRYDEHGVVRCQACGGECEQEAFVIDRRNNDPRIRARCKNPITSDCDKTFSISCSNAWCLLLPMSRLERLYHDVSNSYKSYEQSFSVARRRLTIYGNDKTCRLKVRTESVAAQRLRAHAARLLDWFRFCRQEGWLGSARRARTAEAYARIGQGEYRLRTLLFSRRKKHLDLPYGDAAVRLGIVRAGPPPPQRVGPEARAAAEAAAAKAAEAEAQAA